MAVRGHDEGSAELTPEVGEDLRERRQALGLSLEQVARETRIPVAHLRAIEDGRFEDLPKGPYVSAYLKAYRAVIGFEEVASEIDETAEGLTVQAPSRGPLWAVRIVSFGALLVLIAIAVFQISQGNLGSAPEVPTVDDPLSIRPGEAPAAVAQAGAEHVLALTGQRSAHISVVADGQPVYEGGLAVGERMEFRGRRRIEVELPSVESARVRFDGDRVIPQGRQDLPRRLVFIDDGSD